MIYFILGFASGIIIAALILGLLMGSKIGNYDRRIAYLEHELKQRSESTTF